MPEFMGVQTEVHPCLLFDLAQNVFEPSNCQRASMSVQEETVGLDVGFAMGKKLRTKRLVVGLHRGFRGLGERNQAFFLPFAEDADHPLPIIDVGMAKGHQFGGSHSRRIKQFQNGLIAVGQGVASFGVGFEQSLDFIQKEGMGVFDFRLWGGDSDEGIARDIAPLLEETVIAS